MIPGAPTSLALAEPGCADVRGCTATASKYQYRKTGIGWIPELPIHWDVLPAKRLFREVSAKNHPDEPLLSVLQDGGVVPRSGLDQRVVMPMGALSGFKLVRRGQFVISLRSFQGGIEFSPHQGLVSPAYTVLRPSARVRSDYYRVLLKSGRFIEMLSSAVIGIRDGKNIDYGSFCRIPLPVPPPEEQDAISAFLDRKLEEIDRFIAAKKRMIELLEEQKAAMIDRAVTKGLNASARMKPSGLAWVGDTPAHWRITELRHLIQTDRPIMYGIVLPGPHVEDGVYIVKGGNCEPGRLSPEHLSRTTREIEARYVRSRLRGGDIVYSIRGSIGSAQIVPTELAGANLTQDAARIAARESIDTEWLLWAVSSRAFFSHLDAGATGATIRGINICDLKRAPIVVPPRDEQSSIAKRISAEDRRIALASDRIRREIELMAEYRTALVSDAVTGKSNVSAAVPVTFAVPQASIAAEPAKVGRSANIHFKRSVFAAEIIHRLHEEPTFGHVKCEKLIFLCEKRCGVETGSTYRRKAAGPYDNFALRSIDHQLKRNDWYAARKVGERYQYVPLAKAGGHQRYFPRYFAAVEAEFSRVIEMFRSFDTVRCEIVATLYSAWEDLLADGKKATDDQIMEQVLEHWHPAKQRIPEDRWRKAIGWMKEQGFVPDARRR